MMSRRGTGLALTVGVVTSLLFITLAFAAPAAKSAAKSAPKVTPKSGGTLTVAIVTDLREIDHIQLRISLDKLILGSTVFEPFFQANEDGTPGPGLAITKKASKDLKTWDFTLRKGVKFHNGREFNAEQVKMTIDAMKDPAEKSAQAGEVANIESVEVVDPYNVRFHLKKPDAMLVGALTEAIFFGDMIARKEMGKDKYQWNPVGTGPYKFTERIPGERIVFERNENYWRGRPPLDKVVFRVIPDASVATMEMQTGNVDMIPASAVQIEAIPKLKQDPKLQIHSLPGTTFYQIKFDFEKFRRGGYKGKDYTLFRQGIAHLLDSKKQVPAAIGEFGIYAPQDIPPIQMGHDPSIKQLPYDPEKGKALLAKAGWPKGSEIKLLVWERPFLEPWALIVQSALRDHGYNATFQIFKPEVAIKEVIKYEWDLLFCRTSGRENAAVYFRDRWHSNMAKGDDFWVYADPKFDELIAKAIAEPDNKKREAVVRQMGKHLNKDIAFIGGYWQTEWWANRSYVKGVKLNPLGWFGFLMNNYTTVYLDK
jgi:peptide/nickel transport system substrate-binding protein